jgi:hypothetical protein
VAAALFPDMGRVLSGNEVNITESRIKEWIRNTKIQFYSKERKFILYF